MAKVINVRTHEDLQEVLTTWLNEEEREITSGNVNLIGERVEKIAKKVSPEIEKELGMVIGRLVSIEKQLDGLNDIVLLN